MYCGLFFNSGLNSFVSSKVKAMKPKSISKIFGIDTLTTTVFIAIISTVIAMINGKMSD